MDNSTSTYTGMSSQTNSSQFRYSYSDNISRFIYIMEYSELSQRSNLQYILLDGAYYYPMITEFHIIHPKQTIPCKNFDTNLVLTACHFPTSPKTLEFYHTFIQYMENHKKTMTLQDICEIITQYDCAVDLSFSKDCLDDYPVEKVCCVYIIDGTYCMAVLNDDNNSEEECITFMKVH